MTTVPAPALTIADLDGRTLADVRAELIAWAEATHADYPQYAGHWDDWDVAQITVFLYWRNYRQYPMATAGDLVLARPAGYGLTGNGDVTVFLPKSPIGDGRGMNTSLSYGVKRIRS